MIILSPRNGDRPSSNTTTRVSTWSINNIAIAIGRFQLQVSASILPWNIDRLPSSESHPHLRRNGKSSLTSFSRKCQSCYDSGWKWFVCPQVAKSEVGKDLAEVFLWWSHINTYSKVNSVTLCFWDGWTCPHQSNDILPVWLHYLCIALARHSLC